MTTLDWPASPLGPRELWSPALATTVELLLRSEAEIVLFWGPEFVALYNDAYAPTIGDKHPRALGRPARENWAELWDDLHPLLAGVRETGRTFSAKDRRFYIERHGYGETVYFDVSYSAVPEIDGSVGGVLCVVSETTARVLAARSVAESERRFRALVSATTDIVYRMSADWSEMTQLDGKDILSDVISPAASWSPRFIPSEDRARVEAEVARALDTRTPFECEHRVYLKGGELGWVHSRAVPILDEDGAVTEWFGAASEITEQRRQQERLQVMVHELDHRVKNTLAMVQAIALQTFREPLDLAVAQTVFAQRLKAIADANALLTGEKGAGAALRPAIEQALRPHCPDPARLRLDGPDVAITPKTALAISLALHELATNAVKYGAWSGGQGVVELHWHTAQGEGDMFDLMLDWIELGGPRVAPPTRRGFGSKLIERGLASELDGAVRLRFEPGGVHCSIRARLPADEVARR
ncbi:sensor histidine kinase [Novosphingobium huizhouense]|uniref:sensor histidine kinase n=1 Tax=Novosphingobium huizhouense TaxID=2866625 RepID=UPI001CD88755|nr:HWE histidine kinase domain-containing protein [Novosphingobium huizhouense]